MVTRTWIGGGNNDVNNPADWSPTGVPVIGDTIIMTHGTMNIKGSALPDLNQDVFGALNVEGNVTLNLSDNANVTPINIQSGTATIHVRGEASFPLQTDQTGASAIVDLAANSHWVGDFSAFAGSIVINGHNRAQFINNATSSGATVVEPGTPARVTINADIGDGSAPIDAFAGATVEIGGSAASGQVFQANAYSSAFGSSLDTPGIIKMDHPDQFFGQVQLGIGEIDLVGLTKANSYSYQNDMLSIYSCGRIIDNLSLQQVPSLPGSGIGSFAVEKTAEGVSIYTVGNIHPTGTLLPMHT